MSEAGRWCPNTLCWINDEVSSPCIDTGDPIQFTQGELWPHGGQINIGAYGGTEQASLSMSNAGTLDLNGDYASDAADLNEFYINWLCKDNFLQADLNNDGIVNMNDFAVLAKSYPTFIVHP